MSSVVHSARKFKDQGTPIAVFAGFVSLCVLFNSTFTSVILAALGLNAVQGLTSRIYLLFIVVASIALTLISAYRRNGLKWNSLMLGICIYGIVMLAFVFTRIGFSYTHPVFMSEMLTCGAVLLSVVTLANTVSGMGKFGLEGILKNIPMFILLYTFSVMMVLLGSSSLTSGGLVGDESGMNYQTVSYCAAYAFALNLYYLNHFDIPKIKLFELRFFGKPFWIVLLLFQFALMLTSGGRGGVAVALAASFYFIWSTRHIWTSRILKALLAVGVVVVLSLSLVVLLPALTSSYSMGAGGLDRILGFVDNPVDTGRSSLADRSMSFFEESPYLGHGAGSIFYELGTYSHNLILDISAEFGIIGLFCFIAIFSIYIICLARLIKHDRRNELWVYFTISSFMFLSFSSYWLVSGMLLFPIVYVLSYYWENGSAKV